TLHTLIPPSYPSANLFLSHSTHPVADITFQTSHFLLHLLHDPRQHPRAIVQQSTVGRVVNVTLHHRRVHPHLSPLNHTPLLGQGHNPIMQLTDSLRPDRLSQTHQRLGVRHLLPTDPAEAAIHHIRPHFPFQRFVTPVAHVLQNQYAQGHFRRRWLPTPKPTLRMPLSLGFVDRIHQLLIFQ